LKMSNRLNEFKLPRKQGVKEHCGKHFHYLE
jgi:hypothetical protein